MSEHAWVQENLTAYVAGGLDAGEGERVEAHVAGCESCAAALRDARALDRDMDALFAATRPAPALEDRLIQVLRATTRPSRLPHWGRKLAWGAAATVALGATGAGMSRLVDPNGLPFPGMARDDRTMVASNNLRESRILAGHDASESMRDPVFLDSTAATGDNSVRMRGPEEMAGEISRRALEDGRELTDPKSQYYTLPHIEQDNIHTNGEVDKSRIQDGTSNDVTIRGKQGWADSGSGGLRTFKNNQGQVQAGAPRNNFVGGNYPNFLFFGTSAQNAGGNNNGNNSGNNQGNNGGGFGGQGAGMSMMGGGGFGGQGGSGGLQPPPGVGGGMGMMGGPGMSNGPAMISGFDAGRPAAGGQGGPGRGGGKSLEQTDGDRKAGPGERGESTHRPSPPAPTTPPPANAKYFVPGEHREKDGKQGDANSGKESKDQKGESKPQQDSRGGKGSGPGAANIPVARVDPDVPAEGAGDPKAQAAPQLAARKVIRSGDIEFEVESFDSAVATATKLVMGIRGGFVATINSDKLPNGKVKGSLVVRVPPEQLDGLVLDLRKELGKGGELKGLRIGSQDITKQYYDLESRLKAAKTMQERLLKIIQEGKGEIKQLLEAEKELGVWRTKIEEFEGELRYYNSVVSLSTLTITLAEKEIRSAVDIVEREMVQAGVEVEDVDKAREQVLAAVAEAKGRVTKAEMKQFAAGQFNATLNFEVPPGAGGPLRDRLHQIGNMVRLEIDRVQQAEGGQATRDAKVRRGDTHFNVQLYNVTGIAPRETTTVTLAAADVPAAYRALQDAVVKAKGRVLTGQLNEQDRANVNATLDFEVRRTEETAMQTAIGAAGEIVSRNVNRAALAENTTDAKVRIQASLVDAARITPRETTKLTVASPDVPAAYKALQAAITQAKGRVTKAQLNENDRNNITAQLEFEVRRADEAAIEAALQSAGETIGRLVSRSEQTQNVTDSRVKYETLLGNAAAIAPRETVVLGIEVADVDATAAVLTAQVKDMQGRVADSQVGRQRNGQVTVRLFYHVPLTAAPALVEQFKKHGTVRVEQSSRNPQAPDGKLAIARLDVTLSNSELIVPQDKGLWAQVRSGLSTSLRFLLFSLSWIIFGVIAVLPWAVVGYLVYRLGRRLFGSTATPTPAPATPAA